MSKLPYYKTVNDPKKFNEIYLKNYQTLYYQKKLNEIFRHLPKNLKNKKILDLGCGGGFMSILMAKKGAKVVGVDNSKPGIKSAKYYAKISKVEKNCKFYVSDVTNFKKEKDFDLVLCKDIIEHIPKDIDFLKNINNSLKSGGKIIVTTQNSRSYNYFFEGGLRKLIGPKNWKGWDPTHLRFYNPNSLKFKLNKTGFDSFKFSSSYFFPYLAITKGIMRYEPKHNSLWKIVTIFDKFLGKTFGWSITVSGIKKS